MIHPASPQSRPAVIVAWFWSFGTDGRTLCVKIVITTGRDSGRPRGSTEVELYSIFVGLVGKKFLPAPVPPKYEGENSNYAN